MLLKELYSGCHEVYTWVFDGHVRRLNYREGKLLTKDQKKSALCVNEVPKMWRADEFDEHFKKPAAEELYKDDFEDIKESWKLLIPIRYTFDDKPFKP